jgi:hypothetical protein
VQGAGEGRSSLSPFPGFVPFKMHLESGLTRKIGENAPNSTSRTSRKSRTCPLSSRNGKGSERTGQYRRTMVCVCSSAVCKGRQGFFTVSVVRAAAGIEI